MKLLCKALLLLTSFGLLISSARAATWTTVDFPGAVSSQARAINSAGDIVGVYSDAFNQHGFLLKNGNFTTIDPPGSVRTDLQGINDSGVISGFFQTSTQDAEGFLFDGKNFTMLNFPGFADTVATGINNAGQVVGYYGNFGSNSDYHGFLWTNGSFVTIEVGAEGETVLTGINNRGHITGYNPFNFVTFLRNPQGSIGKIAFSNPCCGLAAGVNDHKVIVGYYPGAERFGFRLAITPKVLTKPHFPGSAATFCFGINNTNQTVGYYTISGIAHGFMRTQ